MRFSRCLPAVVLGLALSAGTAFAQEAPAPGLTRFVGQIDFGGRVTSISGDEARFQRFRDLRDGGTLERLRLTRSTNRWSLQAEADHVGYRDQRYWLNYVRDGRLKVSFEWDQTPLFISRDTRTLFSAEGATLRVDDSIQRSIQAGAATLASVVGQAVPFETRSRRDIARFNLVFTPTRDLDLLFALKSTKREGSQPWGTSFGHGTSVELAAPIDHRTTDLTGAAEWSNGRGMVRLAYDGSWFNNDLSTLVWDNPFVLTDTASVSSQGRAALWPSSRAHTVSGLGSIKLPGRSKATALLSLGSWLQDEDVLPFTINSAIAPIPLARTTADAEARITSMSLGFSSRPTDLVWLNARYRLYDFDNRTPVFAVGNYVRYDGSIGTSLTGGSEPFGYTRQFLDVDASFTPIDFAALRVGYGREHDDRTFRFLDQTTEHVLRASVDTTSLSWLSVRALYEHSKRVGEGFDEEALDEIGEQVSLRQFDISDRNRDRVWLIVQLSPTEQIGLTAQVGAGKDRRPDAGFGLKENDHTMYSLGFDVAPSDAVSLGLTYGYEDYATLQNSRQANPGPQFDDPTRNWATDAADKVHTLTASADLLTLIPKTEFRFGYDLSHAKTRYTYVLPANTTLPTPVQLDPIFHELQRGTADLRYFLSPKVALGVVYWYDRYRADEFGLGPATISRLDLLPAALSIGFVDRPYRAHTAWLKLTYFW